MTTFLVQHNIPLAVTDHLSPLFQEIFPDSKIAKSYGAARTKTTSILNHAMKPHFKEKLVKAMKEEPFSMCTDGSNDKGEPYIFLDSHHNFLNKSFVEFFVLYLSTSEYILIEL